MCLKELTKARELPVNRLWSEQKASVPAFDPNQSLITYAPLFETPVSLGMLAIGAAEGNYRVFAQNGTLFVQQNAILFWTYRSR